MPVRSLSSSVLKWPDARAVDRAVREWAARIAAGRPGIVRIGYIGSYARGDWGVGSDLDIVVVTSGGPGSRIRGAEIAELPVPADLLVYSESEFFRIRGRGRFGRVLAEEAVWIYGACDRGGRGAPDSGPASGSTYRRSSSE